MIGKREPVEHLEQTLTRQPQIAGGAGATSTRARQRDLDEPALLIEARVQVNAIRRIIDLRVALTCARTLVR